MSCPGSRCAFCGGPAASTTSTSIQPSKAHQTDDGRLLEHLPIRPLVRLAINLNRLIPAPLVLDEFLVLRLGWVELGELVTLEVGGDVEGGEGLVSAHEEGTADDGVVAAAVDGGGAEEVFAGGFETVEESAWGGV
jgi:hypothetical protein